MTQPHQPTQVRKPWLPKRWSWLLGLIAALTIGVGAGVAIGVGQAPADDNPKVLAALDDVAQIRSSESQRVAELENSLDDRSDALDQRDSDADAREGDLDDREGKLDERNASLDKRESGLSAREKAVTDTERTIAANSVPGDGVYVVGKDIKAGTYRTSGPSSDGIDICYYAFKTGTGSDAGIVDNNVTKGQATVTVKAGQIFETSSCSDWKRQ